MNNENLIPLNKRSKSEQREIQSKGGKASGVARGFRSSLKRRLKENPELISEILDTLIDMVTSERDIKAAEFLLELAGESPKQQELKLKREELKLRREIEENKNW